MSAFPDDDDIDDIASLIGQITELSSVHALLPEERGELHRHERRSSLRDEEFRAMFRMNHQDFAQLADLVRACNRQAI